MKLLVKRTTPANRPRTFGVLYIDGVKTCHTLEDTVREIQGKPVSRWKIKGVTAIPSGAYKVTLENSPRFGPDTISVHGVEGFSFIRIHAGNSEADTEGCILLGMDVRTAGIANSRQAVTLVKSKIMQAIKNGESVSLTIENFTA
jgi:hypothetical protein